MHERASIGSIFKIKSVTHAPINGYATADRRVDHDDLKEAQLRAHGAKCHECRFTRVGQSVRRGYAPSSERSEVSTRFNNRRQQSESGKNRQQSSREKISTLQGAEYNRNIYTQQVSVASTFDTRSSQVHAALDKAIITTTNIRERDRRYITQT